MQKKGEMKRICLVSSPSKKSRTDYLRKFRITCYRSKVRLLKGKKVGGRTGKGKAKLKQISDETLDHIAHDANLTEAQQLALKERAAACKTGSRKGQRYLDN